jgi:hypothetical protein
MPLDPFWKSQILSPESRNLTKKLEGWLPLEGTWGICWRATRDNWSPTTFHSNCDEKKRTLVVVKVVKNSKIFIFGAFCSVSWAGGKFKFIAIIY